MSEVSTGAGLLPCPFCGGEAEYHSDKGPTGEVYGWVGCNQCDAMSTHCDIRSMQPEETHPIDAWNQRATPKPAGDLVEAVARAMMAASRPNANPDDLTPAPRGTIGFVPKWRLFEHLARAAIAAMADHAAAYEDGYTAGELKWAEAMDKQIDIEENLRTQLAASQADVARLREALFMIEAIGDGSKTANSLPNIAGIARAAIKDTQP